MGRQCCQLQKMLRDKLGDLSIRQTKQIFNQGLCSIDIG
jgi:hypothetical protein